MSTGKFIGIGVGPGPAGMLPVAALQALKTADVILAPRAKSASTSVARQSLDGLGLPYERFRDVVYNMDPDRAETVAHYRSLAKEIVDELQRGNNVAYLTIGDSLTYSTYSYTLEALLELMPEMDHTTFPGVTSYCAIAAALDWPLGQGKERLLILPCPDDPESLRADLETHDIVVLMKIGHRLPMVLTVVTEMGLSERSAFGTRIGLNDELVSDDLGKLKDRERAGYLTTMLIRCKEQAGG